MVLVGQRCDHPRVAGLAVEQGADEDDVCAGLVLGADGADIHRDAFTDRADVFRRDGEIDPDVVEIDDDVELAFLPLAPDQSAEIDAPLRDPAADRRAQELGSQALLRLVWQVGDLALRQAKRKQLLPRAVELDLGVVRAQPGAQELVLRHDAGLDQRLLPCIEGLLQIVGEPSGEIFALGVGDLAAFDRCDDLALLDDVAETLAQFGDRREHAHRDAPDVVGVGNQRPRREEMPLQNAAIRLRHGDTGFANLVFAQFDMAGRLMLGLGLRHVGGRGLLRRSRKFDRPADPSGRQHDKCNAGCHAGEK